MKPYIVEETPKVVIKHEGEVLISYNPFSAVHAKADAQLLNGAYAKGVMVVMSLLESEEDIKLCKDIIKEVI